MNAAQKKASERSGRDNVITDINYKEGWVEINNPASPSDRHKISWLDWLIDKNNYEYIPKYKDGGVMAKGGKVWHKRVGKKDFYFDKNAIWYQQYGTYKLGADGKEYSVNESVNKVYKSKSGLDEIKMYRKNKDYRVINEMKDSAGNVFYIAFLDVSDKMNNTISFSIGDLYAKGGNVTYRHGGETSEDTLMRIEGSSLFEDMQEAEQYMGKSKWDKLSMSEKINIAKYLKSKGLIGMYGEEEDLETLAAMAYKRGGRS